jgi:hypothetical protein
LFPFSALTRRIHFPEPISSAEPSGRSEHATTVRRKRPKALARSRSPASGRPLHCPTADTSVAVIWRAETAEGVWRGCSPDYAPCPLANQLTQRRGVLVAGFHARFGPSAPFSTTLTVFASPSRPMCFNRSHSWGLVSVKRDRPRVLQPRDASAGWRTASLRTVPFATRVEDLRRSPASDPSSAEPKTGALATNRKDGVPRATPALCQDLFHP